GTVRPSALAVLRLRIVSYLVGACTGRSAAFSPRRMRSIYPAARVPGARANGENDGLPRDYCSAGPAPDLRPRPPRGRTGAYSPARVPGQRGPLRPSVSLPLAAEPGRAI